MSGLRLDDTIMAVSTAWARSPVGVLRISGKECFSRMRSLGSSPPAGPFPCVTNECMLVDKLPAVPASVFWFEGPRSYTGHDLLELQLPGSPVLLRRVSERLLAAGARRALPGEFTARAYVNGKLSAHAVEEVYGLIHAEDSAAARRARQLASGGRAKHLGKLREQIEQLLARVEAGIDFVEEEDIRFIEQEELVSALHDLLRMFDQADGISAGGARLPHVALVGLPNAGKSTLFNRLVGANRAIVSPVLGATRDVLSAEVSFGEVQAVLQDCAGLGASSDDLALAAHRATERTAAEADLVLWVHAGIGPLSPEERAAAETLRDARVLLVQSKADLAPAEAGAAHVDFPRSWRVSAASGQGIAELMRGVADELSQLWRGRSTSLVDDELAAGRASLQQAIMLASDPDKFVLSGELIAWELRNTWRRVTQIGDSGMVEDVLGRIFSEFCVGK